MDEAYQIRDQEIEPKEKLSNWKVIRYERFHLPADRYGLKKANYNHMKCLIF